MYLSSFIYTIPPLFFFTSAYMIGLTAEQTHNHPLAFLTLLLLLVLGAYLLQKQANLSVVFTGTSLLACSYILGACLLQYQKKQFNDFHMHMSAKPVDIIGTITDISYLDHPRFTATMTLDNVSTKIHGEAGSVWKPQSKKVQFYTNETRSLLVADTIEVHNITIKMPTSPSYQQYLMKENIGSTLFLSKLSIEHHQRPAWSFTRWLDSKRHDLFTRLKKKMTPVGFSLFCPLFLGKKTAHKKEIMQANTELFTTWGVTHYLARSGLHLVVLIALWLTLFNFLPLSFNKKQYALLIVSISYFLLSWSSIPFYRALATAVLHRLCLLFRLQTHFLHLLILTCLYILLTNPIQLFFLDFQLSFGLTFALSCFSHIHSHHQRHQP